MCARCSGSAEIQEEAADRHHRGGRAVLGIGAAWFEAEHTGFGFDFGDGFPERLRRLGEAATQGDVSPAMVESTFREVGAA